MLLLLLASLQLSACLPQSDLTDALLRTEIEAAAEDSRALADELADMLARLQAEEARSDAVEAAVVGDEVRVEEALQLMIQQMEKLSDASQGSDPNLRLPVSLEEKIQKEEELRSTLEELQIVAEEIGEVTSDEEVKTVAGVSKLLKSVNSKIEKKIQRENFRNENSSASTAEDLNGIEEMIRSLEKVTKDLREMQTRSEFSFDYKEAETEEKESAFNDLLEAALALQPLQNDSNSLDIPKPRRGKQLFDDGDDDDDEGKKEDQKDNVEAKPDYAKPVEPVEDCADKETSDRVRVCEPLFRPTKQPVQLYTGKITTDRHCYNVQRTVCAEKSELVSKEVCIYTYSQNSLVAPVERPGLELQQQQHKMAVTECQQIVTGEGYKKKVVEKCDKHYKVFHYKLPTIAENLDDLVELSLPEPNTICQLYQYEIPAVQCKEVTSRECSEVSRVEEAPRTHTIHTLSLDQAGNCSARVLTQTQQVCSVKHS